MKSITIIATILLITVTAFAYDMTYLTSVKAHSTTQMSVDLPSGKSVTEVWAVGDEKINCTFIDKGTGNIAYQAKDTQKCVGVANLALPANILAKIDNTNDKNIDIRIQVKSSK